MRKRGEESWNGELTPQDQDLDLTMGIARKLEDICQSLSLLEEQQDILGLLTNIKNIQRINDLIEDLHEALMGYQVWMQTHLHFTVTDLYARLHYKKISIMMAVSSL